MKRQPKKNQKSISLKYYILVPLIVILILQVAILAAALVFSGAHDQMNEGIYRVLENTVAAKAESIENTLVRLVDVNEFYQGISDIISLDADNAGLSVSEYVADPENSYAILEALTPYLESSIIEGGVTSGFVILESKGHNINKEAIYLRDSKPTETHEDGSDLVALAGDIRILGEYGIKKDTLWTSTLNANTSCTFYETTYNGGNTYTNLPAVDLGYFSMPVRIHETDSLCITYSIPLLDENHHAYGIAGFDLTLDSLKEIMSIQDLKLDEYDSYYVGVTSDFKSVESVCVANESYYFALKSGNTISISPRNETYRIYDINSSALYAKTSACIYPLRLYASNSPYYSQQWVLAGIMSTSSLHSSSAWLTAVMTFALILALLLSVAGMVIITHFISRPIRVLNKGVQKLAPGYIEIPKTNITEFDRLSQAIEAQNISVYNTGNKMAEIIDIAGFSLGVCEFDSESDSAYCTHQIFDILEISDDGWSHNLISQKLLIQRLRFIGAYLEQNHENTNVYKYSRESYEPKWLDIKQKTNDNTQLIIVSDITESVLEKEKIIHDRDFDILTGLYNRGAFIREMKYLIDGHNCERGVLSIWDLDNLKFTNDTYGHEIGDKYICTLSDLLKKELPKSSIAARLAGDEFTIFLYDEPTHQSIERLTRIHTLLMQERLALPDGKELNMSASAGMAFFDKDADNYEELLKYADFAMYQIKKSSKGSIKAFNRESYVKDYILVQGVGELDRIIADEAIRYAYQPIISVKTGKVFAYEALIRPVSDLLERPDNLLRVATAQSKLDKIERITWFHALSGFFSQVREDDNARIFINSIPNQLISEEDWRTLESLYGSKLSRIVMEFTEGEKSEIEMDERKRQFCRKWNIPVALDDYGSGYSNSDILVSRIFHFVKLDMSLMHNINDIPSTQALVKSIISYCHDNLLMVIAEGIETQSEYDTVKELGADFVQGFYLAKPSYSLYP